MGLVLVVVITPWSPYTWPRLTRTNRITGHFILLPPLPYLPPISSLLRFLLYTRISFLSLPQCDLIVAVFCRPQIVIETFRKSLDKSYSMLGAFR